MPKEILYTTAIDERGNLVHVDDAKKGRAYYCPSCNDEFILRKSGNTGKWAKRPHFAHNNLTPNCTAEGVLHYSFKRELTDLLNNYLSENKEFIINWECLSCSESCKGNLLAKVSSIREEYHLKVCQPDIALLDARENVIAVIEIVVSHEPEEKVLQFYEENGIVLIQVNLSSNEDLKNVKGKLSNPNIVNYCLTPECSNYNSYPIKRKIIYYQDSCNKCLRPIRKFAIEVNSTFGKQYSLDFTDDEINTVKSKCKNIKIKTNPSTNERYPTSICHCHHS